MKKTLFGILIIFFLSETAYSDDYKWDLINALVRNDLEIVEKIIRTNIASMTAADKNLMMNFAMNYSSGENTLKVCQLLP